MRKLKGFTLIELLVVIAIIGILAAMLFPVFARARESARKIQCLSNVKNIAMAVQMYLSDYDAFPPNHKDAECAHWIQTVGDGCDRSGSHRWNGVNPFLRWPVILDEYIKDRGVWVCPSAQHVSTPAWIVPDYTAVWWWYLRDNGFGCGGPCCEAWPPGWGGSVTDSVAQHTTADSGSPGIFEWSISTTAYELAGRAITEIDDPAQWVVCGDNQQGLPYMQEVFGAAYGSDSSDCCWKLSESDRWKFNTDPGFRKKYAPHMGGLNLGFADGHAKWWDAEAAVTEGGICRCQFPTGPNDPCHGIYEPHKSLKGFCPDFEVIDDASAL